MGEGRYDEGGEVRRVKGGMSIGLTADSEVGGGKGGRG